jgi:hypothetical protein
LRCKKHFWKKAQRNPNVVYDLILKSDVWHLDDGINLDSQPKMDEAEFLYYSLLQYGEGGQSCINLTCVWVKVIFECRPNRIDWKLIS